VSGVGLPSGEVVLGSAVGEGWWAVDDEDGGRVLAGPCADRAEAAWSAGPEAAGAVRVVWAARRPDGSLARRPSPQEWAWLAHLQDQLDLLPEDWDDVLTGDEELTTLVVELTAALAEAGLPLHDPRGGGAALGGVSLVAEPALGGILVAWRQHDRMSLEQVHGAAPDAAVQQVMNQALAGVLAARGFAVEPFGGAGGHVVRPAA
jgi:hypothetical protein